MIENSEIDRFPINAKVTVDRERKYQKIFGFGGAFTGTVSYLLSQLPETVQNFLYRLDRIYSIFHSMFYKMD